MSEAPYEPHNLLDPDEAADQALLASEDVPLEASEGDAVEQRVAIDDPQGAGAVPHELPLEADEGDSVEQEHPVATDEEEYR